jgi:outer membrane protein assembly factor BamB
MTKRNINKKCIFILLAFLSIQCKKSQEQKSLTSKADTASNTGTIVPGILDFNFLKATRADNNLVVIEWTAATGSAADNSLNYNVVVNDIVVASNLKTTSYTLTKILATLPYAIQIIARNSKGSTKTVKFTIASETNFIYAYNQPFRSSAGPNHASCYTTSGLFVWTKSIGFMETGTFSDDSGPVMAHDTLFTRGIDTVKYEKAIYAFNAKTGAIYWTTTVDKNPQIELLYHNGIVYHITTRSIDAYKASTGGKLWHKNNINIYKLPVVSNGVLLCNALTTSNQHQLIAYNADTGEEKWHFETGHSLGLPTEKNGVVYIVDSYYELGSIPKGFFYALNSKTGQQKWSFAFDGNKGISNVQLRPLVMGDFIYFYIENNNSYIVKLNKNTGGLIWRSERKTDTGYLMGDDTGIYMVSSSSVYKFDLETCKTLWNKPFYGAVVLHPDGIYTHQYDGIDIPYPLYTYSKLTGNIIVSQLSKLQLLGGFVISSNGTIYYPARSGMYAPPDFL